MLTVAREPAALQNPVDVPRPGRRPHDLPDHDVPRHRRRGVLGGALWARTLSGRIMPLMRTSVHGSIHRWRARWSCCCPELLLPAGIALKITGVLPKDASGLTIITCEDDDDAPTLVS